MLPVALWLLSALGTVLVALLAWLGNMVFTRLKEIAELLRVIEGDLRGDLADLDRRVSRIEGKLDAEV